VLFQPADGFTTGRGYSPSAEQLYSQQFVTKHALDVSLDPFATAGFDGQNWLEHTSEGQK